MPTRHWRGDCSPKSVKHVPMACVPRRLTYAELLASARFLAVPFDAHDLVLLRTTPDSLLEKGIVKPMIEPAVPKVPMDYTWAKRLGLVRKPANFISSISDDRGDELRSVLQFCISVPRLFHKYVSRFGPKMVQENVSHARPSSACVVIRMCARYDRAVHFCFQTRMNTP